MRNTKNYRYSDDEMRSMLSFITDYQYSNWVKIGMALHKDGYSADLFVEWSSRDTGTDKHGKPSYKGYDACLKKWNSFHDNNPKAVGVGTIAYQAKQNGWSRSIMQPLAPMPVRPAAAKQQEIRKDAVEEAVDIRLQIMDARDRAAASEEAKKHFLSRIPDEAIISKYMLGYMPEGFSKALNGIDAYKQSHSRLYTYSLPYIEKGGAINYCSFEIENRENIDEDKNITKYRKPSKMKQRVYNRFYLQDSDKVPEILFITEGIYDALSIELCGGNAISIVGLGSAALLEDLDRYNVPKSTRFIVALDGDEIGLKSGKDLHDRLTDRGYISRQCIFNSFTADGELLKDANAMLLYDPEKLKEKVASEIKEVSSGFTEVLGDENTIQENTEKTTCNADNQQMVKSSRGSRGYFLYREDLNEINDMEGEFLPIESFKTKECTMLPEFNLDWLPDTVFRRYARAMCEELQVTPDMVGMAMITAVSAALQKRMQICIKAGYYEPVTLYCAIVADPGERKSAVQRKIIHPFIEYEKTVNQSKKDDLRKYERELSNLKERQKELKRKKSRTDEDNAELDGIADQIDSLEKPSFVRMQTDNATTEALYSLMEKNNECMSIFSSEGGIFKIAAGLYNDSKSMGGNIDIFLKAYDNEYASYDRKTDDKSIVMYVPSLAILLFVQPKVIQEIMCNEEFKGRGFNQRFAYVFPKSLIGERKFFTSVSDDHLRKQYIEIMMRFLSMMQYSVREDTPIFRFSREASGVIDEYFHENELLLKDKLKDMRGWGSKSLARMARIALCLHSMKYAGGVLDHREIDKDIVVSAIQIENYLIDHAIFAFNGMGEIRSPREKDGIFILEKITKILLKEKTPKTPNTDTLIIEKQVLWQECRDRMDTTRKMQRGLEELVSRKIIRIKKNDPGEKGGRPKEVIEVNPLYREALPDDE